MPFKGHIPPTNRMARLPVASVDASPVQSPTQPPQAGPSRKRKIDTTTTESRRSSVKSGKSSRGASESASVELAASRSPSPSPPLQTQFDTQNSDDLWDAIAILDERGETGSGFYLIQWAGIDPDTGNAWEPTWEHRRDVTPALAAEWKQKKKLNPGIIGVEGRKLADAKKAEKEAERKRKREEKEAQKKKKKAKTNKPRDSTTSNKRTTPTSSVELIEPPKQPRTIVSAENVAELHEEDNASHVSDQVDQADIQTNGVDHDITREPLEQQTSANSIQNGEASTSKGKKQRAKARASSNDKASVGVDMPPPRHPKSASVSESVDNRTRKVRVEPVPTTFGEGLQPEGSGSNETEETSASQVPLVPDTRVEQEADQTAIIIDNSPIGAETETPGVEAEAEVPMETDSNTPAVAETSVVAKVWTTVKRSYLDQHGPVPVPSAEQFRSFLPPGQVGDIESYQSTTSLGPSQLDPISQYPSPLRDPQTKNKGKGKGKAQQSGDSTQMAKKSKGRPRKDGGSKSAPVIVKRYINGEEVLAVESEESTESDSEYRPDPVPVPALAPAPASESAPTPATEPAPPHASEPAPASASVAASVPVTEDAMEVDTVPVSTENLDASQLPETVDVAPVAEAVETDAPAVQAIMQSLYESKNAEVANLQAQLAEKQKLVDELEAKVKLAETQAQAQAQAQEEAQAKAQAQAIPVPAEPIATTTDQTSAVLVETSDVSIQVDAPELVPNGVHTQAVEASSQPANSTTEASTSVVPSRNDATDTSIPTSEPSVSAEEVARLLALKDAETKKERIRAKRAERNNREMEDTLQFMRAQYEEASNSAVREVNKVKELEETVERLQGQLKFGLKQREMASEALVTQLKTESARYKRQVKVLLDQNRLTDDNVRKRAAAYHGLKSDVTRLEAALKLAKAKNQDLSDRNDELLGQVEFFRAREMGVIPPADDSDDEDYEYEYASSDSESDTSDPLSPPNKILAQQSAVRSTDTSPSQLMPETQDLAPMVPSLPMGQTQTLAPTLAPEAITHDVEIHQDVFESPLIRDLYFVNEAAVKEHIMQEVDHDFA